MSRFSGCRIRYAGAKREVRAPSHSGKSALPRNCKRQADVQNVTGVLHGKTDDSNDPLAGRPALAK